VFLQISHIFIHNFIQEAVEWKKLSKTIDGFFHPVRLAEKTVGLNTDNAEVFVP
jgi:hypothetical protein